MNNNSTLIIGCGSIGERHLRCFQKTGRTSVTACDTNPELLKRVADEYSVPAVDDWERAIESGRFQNVVICTPAPFHIPMAIAAFQNKINTLIEKPLSNSLEDVGALLDAHAKSGVQVSVAYVLHVYPALLAARDFIRSGELGKIRHVVVTAGQPFHLARPAYAKIYYKDRRTGGGAIQDALTHSANWVESVIGPTDSVMCDCAHLALPDVEVEDTAHVNARNADALVNYTMVQFQAPDEINIQLSSATGSVKVEVHNQRWGVMRMGEKAWVWQDARVGHRDDYFIAQANAFLDQVEGKPSRLCTLEAAVQTLRFNCAALASSGLNRRVYCKDALK